MPSSKALGKRPDRKSMSRVSEPPAEAKSKADPPAKRVLPSRSRRGGPGVGSCDVDDMILDAQRRALEYKPILPANAVFTLTTDSSTVPSHSSPNYPESSAEAYSSYFDKPEVQESFRAQALIQTPSFTQLTEAMAVEGRLRIRTEEAQEVVDTSDAAYERRHRKYETFEKRQRRREKEKLVHEHHKLKERIEQLRAMDLSAFAGTTAPEQERTRHGMLVQAKDLDRRYTLLLPPEPRRGAARKPDDADSDDRQRTVTPVAERPTIKLRLKIAPRISQKNPKPPSPEPTSPPPSSPASPRRSRRQSNAKPAVEPTTPPAVGQLPSKQVKRIGRPRGRIGPDKTHSILFQSASHTEPNAKRKTTRHSMVFGIKIPKEVEDHHDYELPWFITRGGPALGEDDAMEDLQSNPATDDDKEGEKEVIPEPDSQEP